MPGDFDDDAAFDKLRRTIEELDEARGTGGNHAFYLAIPPGVLRRRGRPAQGARPRRPARRTPGGGSWWRSRSATTWSRRASSTTILGRRLPDRLDLPDRPLPRQGDGPEHPGDALRQQDVRADLERQLRRPRADHHGRGHRHRRPRRLLRRHRRRPRRHPEPPAAADGAGRDGGADVVRRREPADREAEGALQRRAARSGSTSPPRAASTPRAGPGGEKVQRLPRRGGHHEDLDDRDVRRGHPARRHPALGRRAVLPAHRQAARAPGHRGGGRLQAGAAPAVQPRPPPRS